ncbi:reverse transcriptase domain-containing protein [Tanacetum coccineum]|uniref:Reverse transcriptase domain-containing protein n=1 Tax=Tanacetum coccineum TaxID=301880 RepID=A0ABQ4XHG6_9ASTR
MPNNVKTYDGTGDPEDHLKIFQAAAQVERWAMPTWCHMFNSTLIGAARVWFDELPPESIDGYKGLKAAFLAYFMQQKKYVKDPVEIHNIKQRDGETIEDFMERFKVETGRMKGAPECMRISGFMHGVNNPELTKRLNEHVPKTMEEMMTVTTAFIRGEAATASKKKGHLPWKSQDQSKRHASERRSDFRGKFKPPPPMVTPTEKRSRNKFCDFYNDKGHSTNEYMQLKKQIEELVRAGKLSHLIKEIKQGRDQIKNGKKEAPTKDKSLAIYMIQPWQRMTRQKLTQSFAHSSEITFPPLANSDGTEGPLVIEAETGGHMIHRMYIDGGSSTEILYEHCFNQLWPEIKNQMVPTTTSLTRFSGETIWPLGQLRLLVTIGDADHSTKSWMNFMIVRSLSPYNGIIGRLGIREIQAVPSITHGMLKFPANGGIVTIHSTILIPAECTIVITSSKEKKRRHAIEHSKAIQEEVQKLVEAGIIREVYYHDWLSNPIMSEEDVFMLSLICNVEAECEKLLTCNMDIGFINVLKYDTEVKFEAGIGSQIMIFMYVVDLQRNVYYQKCYDPDCRGCRSPFHPVPPDVMFKSFKIGEQNESQMDRREKDDWWSEAIITKFGMKTMTGGCPPKQLHQKLSVHTMDKLELASEYV